MITKRSFKAFLIVFLMAIFVNQRVLAFEPNETFGTELCAHNQTYTSSELLACVLVSISVLMVAVLYVRRFYLEKLLKAQDDLKSQTDSFNATKELLELQQESLNNALLYLSVLSESGQCIIKSQSMKDISQNVYEEIKKFFEIDYIGVGIYNGPHSSIDFPSFVLNGNVMPFARYNVENISNMIVWSFINRKSVVISDYKSEVGNYIDTDYYKLDTSLFGSAVYVPLYDNDMTIGMFTVHSLKKNFFTSYHLSIINNLATYVEFAIVNISYIRRNEFQKKLIEERNVELQNTYNDLKENQQKLEDLNSELQRFSVSVSNTENAVIMLDENRNIIWVNNAFTKIYGYTFEEYTAKGANYKVAMNNPATIAYYDEVFRDCKPKTFTLLHYTKTGKEIWIQSSVTPILDSNGNVIQTVSVDTDISKVKFAETEITKQRNEIELKNKEVTKSIEYASIIQTALMTGKAALQQLFSDSFYLNLPKAIVSGDFLWIGRKFGRKYIALCDCAGHGVPGAFVSLMGKMFLDEILQTACEEDTPGILIRELNDKLHKSVNSLSNKIGGVDGMDLSFCIVNSDNTMLEYAGAYRPLYIVRQGELSKLQPDRCSLGNIDEDSDFQFATHEIELCKGDFLFMTSDGYSDQFGQENGKKMGRVNFYKLITEAASLSCDEMSKFFLERHISWRGSLEQVDDISMVGIRIS